MNDTPHRLVYLVGEPGVGKSTVMARATDTWQRFCHCDHPRRELLHAPGSRQVAAVELGARAGRHHAGFPGTDALPMNTVVAVEEWLASGRAAAEAPLVLGEGARLGVRRFLHAAMRSGWEVHVALLTSTHAARNRAERGSQQDPAWIKGATTRARNFYTYAAGLVGDGVAGAHEVPAEDIDHAANVIRHLARLDVP